MISAKSKGKLYCKRQTNFNCRLDSKGVGLRIDILLTHKTRRNPMNRAKLLRRLAVATVALLYTWISGPPSAQADTETWNIESSYPYQVQLKFYSQDRNAVWPSASRAYLLDDSRV